MCLPIEFSIFLIAIVSVNGNIINNPVNYERTIDLSSLGGSLYGAPDAEVGARVSTWTPEDAVNPEELGSYVQGDLLMNRPKPVGKNGLTQLSARWAQNRVPYRIKGNFNAAQMSRIEDAINQYHAKTCIKFTPWAGEKDYITITSENSGCWSSVGRVGGEQQVNLQIPGCVQKSGTVIHELMHALGFMHEQNRSERDNYIQINWANVKSGTKINFDKAPASSTSAFNVPYDYGSVMHYSRNAFSSNGQATIIPKGSAPNMGQRDGFSQGDVEKLKRMYNCGNSFSNNHINSGDSSVGKPEENKFVSAFFGLLSNLAGMFAEESNSGVPHASLQEIN